MSALASAATLAILFTTYSKVVSFFCTYSLYLSFVSFHFDSFYLLSKVDQEAFGVQHKDESQKEPMLKDIEPNHSETPGHIPFPTLSSFLFHFCFSFIISLLLSCIFLYDIYFSLLEINSLTKSSDCTVYMVSAGINFSSPFLNCCRCRSYSKHPFRYKSRGGGGE